jgi:hypothetical protein
MNSGQYFQDLLFVQLFFFSFIHVSEASKAKYTDRLQQRLRVFNVL